MQWGAAVWWGAIVVAFLIMGVWEGSRPRQALTGDEQPRWGSAGLLLLTGGALQATVFRLSPLVVAAWAGDSPWGLLNRAWMPGWMRFTLAILALDFVHYLTHRLFHANGYLWRVHEVHHSDPDFDVSTAGRFHPFEILIVKACYLAGIAVLAPPVMAVFFAELHTGLLNVFAHANVALPAGVERWLRRVIITPELHRLHHSDDEAHYDRNFGQTFVFWDRLCGTYLPGVEGVVRSGVKGVPAETRWRALLLAPFASRQKEKRATCP